MNEEELRALRDYLKTAAESKHRSPEYDKAVDDMMNLANQIITPVILSMAHEITDDMEDLMSNIDVVSAFVAMGAMFNLPSGGWKPIMKLLSDSYEAHWGQR